MRRILGLVTGILLVLIGAGELALNKADFEQANIQLFCRGGFCADQFSLARIFDIGQKATLGDPHGELDDFRRAVTLSPASAYRWADLGEAEFNVRDLSQAEYAFSRALEAGPNSPVILLRAANLYFEIGDDAMVARQLTKVLSDPGLDGYYDAAFLTFSRLGLPIGDILRTSVPQRVDVMSALLQFWAKTRKTDEAIATWQWASERSLADDASTDQVFKLLMQQGRQDEAQQLWQGFAKKQEPDYRTANWIYNPGFESALDVAPFDWSVEMRHDIETDRVQDVKFDGRWSFRIRFNGESNTAYHQMFQDMVLPPGKYNFSVMIKTEQVTTDEGIRLHIFEPPSQASLNVWTDTVVGTHDWMELSKSFEVPSGLKLVRVEIARMSSVAFDNKIGGTTWLDAVKLTKN